MKTLKIFLLSIAPTLFCSCSSSSDNESVSIQTSYETENAEVFETITFEGGMVSTHQYFEYDDDDVDGLRADSMSGVKDSDGNRQGEWKFFVKDELIGNFQYENDKIVGRKRFVSGVEYDSLSGPLDHERNHGKWTYYYKREEVGKREFYFGQLVPFSLSYVAYKDQKGKYAVQIPQDWSLTESDNKVIIEEDSSNLGSYRENLTIEVIDIGNLDHEKAFENDEEKMSKIYQDCKPEDLGYVNWPIYFDTNRLHKYFYQTYYRYKENGSEIILRVTMFKKNNLAFKLTFKCEKDFFEEYEIHFDKMNDYFDC